MAGLRIVVAAVGLACALGLAGCQSNPEPAPLPSVSPSASVSSPAPSSSASVMPPTMPAAARGRGEKSAKAFARHFIHGVNYAVATGDVSVLHRLGTADCASCSAIVGNVKKVYRSGGHIVSQGWKIDALRVVQANRGRAVVSLALTLTPQTVVSANGKEEHHSGGKQPMDMFLEQRAGEWRVSRLDLVS